MKGDEGKEGGLLKLFPSPPLPLIFRVNKNKENGENEGEIFLSVFLPSPLLNIPKKGNES